jgi:hypothetical protein
MATVNMLQYQSNTCASYQSTERSSNKHRQVNGEAYSHLYVNTCKVRHEDKSDITGKIAAPKLRILP